MKKRIFLVISAMFVFGLAIVVYSSAATTNLAASAASCCCCHGDSCPMKSKDASGKEVASAHESCECCDGDTESCPMMKKDADGKPVKMDAASCPMMKKNDASATTVKSDGKVSCPMMKKDADGKDMKMDNAGSMSGMHMKHGMKNMKMHGKDCDCSCCHKTQDKEKIDAPAV